MNILHFTFCAHNSAIAEPLGATDCMNGESKTDRRYHVQSALSGSICAMEVQIWCTLWMSWNELNLYACPMPFCWIIFVSMRLPTIGTGWFHRYSSHCYKFRCVSILWMHYIRFQPSVNSTNKFSVKNYENTIKTLPNAALNQQVNSIFSAFSFPIFIHSVSPYFVGGHSVIGSLCRIYS